MIPCLWPSRGPIASTASYQHVIDCVPKPPRPLPPAEARENLGEVGPSNVSRPPSSSPPCPVLHSSPFPSHPKIKTQPNSFGLFHLYDEGSLPNYDPETENLLDEAGPFLACESSSRLNKGITDPSNPFHPYPNEKSLLLGIGIGLRDTRSLRQALSSSLILSETQNITPKMYGIRTGW